MPSPVTTDAQVATISAAVERLLAIPEESARRSLLQQNPELRDANLVLHIASQVPKIAREDVGYALRMARLASWLSEILDDDYCRARSARAVGHPLQLQGKLKESLAEYQKAIELFIRLKLEKEIGITLSSSLQPLILLGNYEEARRREETARKIFKAEGDDLRLARLDSNLGNILHRQDRFEEALVLYGRAEQGLARFDAIDDLAIVLNNLAVCYISLRDFASALEAYKRLRNYSEQKHLQLLTVQADYNIAYLHYLEGKHHRAIDLYKQTRIFCKRAGDPYHAALCDLDHAEICLHLNQYEECIRLAQEALAEFRELKMNYEAAKACTFLALTACHGADYSNGLELLAQARELFLLEQNWIWPAAVDLYRAIALYAVDRWVDALKSVTAAQSVLSHSPLREKAALAETVRSVLHLQLGDSTAARYWGEMALQRVEGSEINNVRYLAEFVLGQIRESQNDVRGAQEHYERARVALQMAGGKAQSEDSGRPLPENKEMFRSQLISAVLRLPGRDLTQKPGMR
jgi:tetratricopeptide (TPR) repeat protein